MVSICALKVSCGHALKKAANCAVPAFFLRLAPKQPSCLPLFAGSPENGSDSAFIPIPSIAFQIYVPMKYRNSGDVLANICMEPDMLPPRFFPFSVFSAAQITGIHAPISNARNPFRSFLIAGWQICFAFSEKISLFLRSRKSFTSVGSRRFSCCKSSHPLNRGFQPYQGITLVVAPKKGFEIIVNRTLRKSPFRGFVPCSILYRTDISLFPVKPHFRCSSMPFAIAFS